MPYKFKSRATGDLIMLDANARKLLAIVGKDAEGAGILTVEQIPGAIAALEQAVRSDEAQRAAAGETQETDEEQGDAEATTPRDTVTLRQRTAPLVDMLQRSAAEGREVTWGN